MELQVIKKNQDGTLTYDFEKYFTLSDAVYAEWLLASPTFELSVLSDIMETIWDKSRFIVDGKNRFKPERWDNFVKEYATLIKKDKDKKCYCEELIEMIRPVIAADSTSSLYDKRVSLDDGGNGPGIYLMASVDNRTMKRVYFTLSACEEGESFAGDLKCCPFCGRDLSKMTIDDIIK
jgi:hypothetical protein